MRFALRFSPTAFAIFDAFPHDAGRKEHLTGRVAKALMMRAAKLLTKPPVIEEVDVLAAKVPIAEVKVCPPR